MKQDRDAWEKRFQDPEYKAKRSKQPLPYNFEIELTEGCNLFCDHCGIRTLWKDEKKLHFMTPYFAYILSREIGEFNPRTRIDFAMHGEPTLNKDLVEIIGHFRKNIPKAQITLTSNGIIMRKEGGSYVKSLFDAGVNFIYLSAYGGEKDNFNVGDIKTIDFHACNKEELVKYNPHYYHDPKKTKFILHVGDIKENAGTRKVRTMFNVGGNVDFDLMWKYNVHPLQRPLQKLCSKPFHDMTIDYDGTVVSCCLDWMRVQIMGKFPEESLKQIWFEGERFKCLRLILRNKRRDLAPLCSQCDYVGGLMLALVPHVFGNAEEGGKRLSELLGNPIKLTESFKSLLGDTQSKVK